MAERKKYDPGLVCVGELLANKRKALGPKYKTREHFIELRSNELFGGNDWISPRHLANIELDKYRKITYLSNCTRRKSCCAFRSNH